MHSYYTTDNKIKLQSSVHFSFFVSTIKYHIIVISQNYIIVLTLFISIHKGLSILNNYFYFYSPYMNKFIYLIFSLFSYCYIFFLIHIFFIKIVVLSGILYINYQFYSYTFLATLLKKMTTVRRRRNGYGYERPKCKVFKRNTFH